MSGSGLVEKVLGVWRRVETIRRKTGRRAPARHLELPYLLHFEPSLDALSLRSDVISSPKILSLPA